MVEEHEGLSDDARQQADGAVDASAAELEVAEAAELEGFQVGVWSGSISGRFGGRGVCWWVGPVYERRKRGFCGIGEGGREVETEANIPSAAKRLYSAMARILITAAPFFLRQ